MIGLTDPDAHDENEKCTLIVGLWQKSRIAMRTLGDGPFMSIGFTIYKVCPPKRVTGVDRSGKEMFAYSC